MKDLINTIITDHTLSASLALIAFACLIIAGAELIRMVHKNQRRRFDILNKEYQMAEIHLRRMQRDEDISLASNDNPVDPDEINNMGDLVEDILRQGVHETLKKEHRPGGLLNQGAYEAKHPGAIDEIDDRTLELFEHSKNKLPPSVEELMRPIKPLADDEGAAPAVIVHYIDKGYNLAVRGMHKAGILMTSERLQEIEELENAAGEEHFIDIVFDKLPDNTGATLIEVENAEGKSIRFGEWIERPNGYAALRVPVSRDPNAMQPITKESAIAAAQADDTDYQPGKTSGINRGEGKPKEPLCDDEGCDHYGTKHVCVSNGTHFVSMEGLEPPLIGADYIIPGSSRINNVPISELNVQGNSAYVKPEHTAEEKKKDYEQRVLDQAEADAKPDVQFSGTNIIVWINDKPAMYAEPEVEDFVKYDAEGKLLQAYYVPDGKYYITVHDTYVTVYENTGAEKSRRSYSMITPAPIFEGAFLGSQSNYAALMFEMAEETKAKVSPLKFSKE